MRLVRERLLARLVQRQAISEELVRKLLAFWNHEQAIATASGVERLSPPQQELLLIH